MTKGFNFGGFPNRSKSVNDAYFVYAELYLDYVDSNPSHFLVRGVDVRPIEDLDDDADDAVVAKAYIDASKRIVDYVREMSAPEADALLEKYPTLR